jgi:hypothetical protein
MRMSYSWVGFCIVLSDLHSGYASVRSSDGLGLIYEGYVIICVKVLLRGRLLCLVQ